MVKVTGKKRATHVHTRALLAPRLLYPLSCSLPLAFATWCRARHTNELLLFAYQFCIWKLNTQFYGSVTNTHAYPSNTHSTTFSCLFLGSFFVVFPFRHNQCVTVSRAHSHSHLTCDAMRQRQNNAKFKLHDSNAAQKIENRKPKQKLCSRRSPNNRHSNYTGIYSIVDVSIHTRSKINAICNRPVQSHKMQAAPFSGRARIDNYVCGDFVVSCVCVGARGGNIIDNFHFPNFRRANATCIRNMKTKKNNNNNGRISLLSNEMTEFCMVSLFAVR